MNMKKLLIVEDNIASGGLAEKVNSILMSSKFILAIFYVKP